MFKKLISIVLAAITMSFLSSCTKGNKDEGKVVVRYMFWGNVHQREVTRSIAALFEKKYPEIKLRMEHAPGQYWTKLQTMLASNTAPDVMLMNGPNCLAFAGRNAIKDITPFIERDGIDLSEYYKTAVDCFRYKGNLYALPVDFKTVALYYNKTMFDKENLSYPDESWGWKEFLDTAKKLTKDHNSDGKIDQWGLWFPSGVEDGWNNFVWQNGGSFLNREKTKSMLDSPEAVEAIQFVKDLYWKHKATTSPSMNAASLSATADPFMSGKIGMRIAGAWMTPSYRKIKDFDWDVAPLPKGKKRAASANGLAHSICEKTKHPEEAWKFVKFLSSPPAQEIYAKTGRAIPILKKMANSEVYLNPELKPYNKKVFLDEMEYAHDLEFTANWNEWVSAVYEEFTLIWLNKVSAEEGCRKAAERANRLLKEIQE